MAQKEKESAEIRQSLSQIQNIVVREQMQRAQAKLQADIGKAVETVNAEVNHPKPKVIEAILDAKAREDYRFKQLFDNRDKNPAAWEKALKVVAKEIKNDFSLKVDPNLQESQRQRKLAQSAMATTAAPEKDDEWSNLTQEEFDAKWQRMASGG